MTTCDAWNVVVVPFPFIDMGRAKPRPALVLSRQKINHATGFTVLAMITRGLSTHWSNDTPIQRLGDAGLSVESVVRWKVFSLDNRLISRQIGKLASVDRKTCQDSLRRLLAL